MSLEINEWLHAFRNDTHEYIWTPCLHKFIRTPFLLEYIWTQCLHEYILTQYLSTWIYLETMSTWIFLDTMSTRVFAECNFFVLFHAKIFFPELLGIICAESGKTFAQYSALFRITRTKICAYLRNLRKNQNCEKKFAQIAKLPKKQHFAQKLNPCVKIKV